MPPFGNIFKRKPKEEPAQAQPAVTRAVPAHPNVQHQVALGRVLARVGPGAPTNILDSLTRGQDALQRLRTLPANDAGVFPLVNEAQRMGQ